MKICGYVPIERKIIVGSDRTYPQFTEKNFMYIGWDFWFRATTFGSLPRQNMTATAEFAIIAGSPGACQ